MELVITFMLMTHSYTLTMNKNIFFSSLENLEQYIADIRQWMNQNLLELNDNKTYIIYMASPYCIKSLITPELHVGDICITSSDSVKYVGIIFDKCFNRLC